MSEDLATCTRCETKAEETELARYLDWLLCEVCVGDI
jgi:hypothetical protein